MFENELTWVKASMQKGEDLFHSMYEKAIVDVAQEFGKTYSMIINGKKVTTSNVFPDISPIDTRIVIGYVPRGRIDDVSAAIASARKAYHEWSRRDYRERTAMMKRAADIMSKKKYELAALLTYENGKNRYEAIADVDEGIDFLRYYAEELEENDGFIRSMNNAYPEEKSRSVMKPYGVWAVISPFNFPIAITTGMCAGAMITGNTVILKPSSDTPISAVKLVEIFEEAGIPEGVINLVTGSGSEVGNPLINSDDIDGIVFTGSREVGLNIYTQANSKRPKPVITEMGGKNPALIGKSANIKSAALAVMRAAFGYSGQKCSACSRVYIHAEIKDEFLDNLVKLAREVKVGNPIERDVFTGPVINENAYENFKKYSSIAARDGTILVGGKTITDNELREGYYVQPTIVDGLSKDHPFFKDELFLPILSVAEYEDFDVAINMCNDVDYGLTAGIFSNDKDEIDTFLDRIEAGVIYVNRERSATTGAMVGCQPFVGWKFSGISGKGTGSKYYLPLFMREQSQTIC